jgi:RND family efflux transporter MFP subunit
MWRQIRRLAYLAIVAGTVAIVWWYYIAPAHVHVATPSRGPAVEVVYATGTVEPVRWAKIASTETGRIVDYPADEGCPVRKGEVLVRLDDTEARAAVRELEARVRFLEADVNRYTTLLKRDNVSRKAYDQATSELEQARAAVEAARQRVADLIIVAPLDGVVLRKDREVGEVVQADDVLLWVGQDRPYWITAEVDEEDIPRVRTGQRAFVTADAFAGDVLEGEISEITPKGDPVNKNYRVRVLLQADSPLMVGMTTEVNIMVRTEENALLVPESAIGDGAVWLAEAGHTRRREARFGAYGARLVEVLSGLVEQDSVYPLSQ